MTHGGDVAAAQQTQRYAHREHGADRSYGGRDLVPGERVPDDAEGQGEHAHAYSLDPAEEDQYEDGRLPQHCPRNVQGESAAQQPNDVDAHDVDHYPLLSVHVAETARQRCGDGAHQQIDRKHPGDPLGIVKVHRYVGQGWNQHDFDEHDHHRDRRQDRQDLPIAV